MKNLINPRQYEPYALNTSSGNLYFVENVDNFEAYLLEVLTGSFNIVGGLKVNTGEVLSIDSTNEVETQNAVLNSFNSIASGQYNTIINSNASEVSGSYNTIIGGRNNQIADSDNSAIIFGEQTVLQFHTGAAIIGDGDNARTKTSVTHNSLTIDFASGTFFKNDVFIEGDFYSTGTDSIFDSDINVAVTNSGLFSGDIQILGTAYHTGSALQNLQNLIDSSGDMLAIVTGASGLAHDELVSTSGILSTSIETTGDYFVDNYIDKTSHQTISGPKYLDVITGQRINIGATGRSIPSAYNSAGISGDISFDAGYIYVCTGNNAWARAAIAAWP